MKGERYQGPVVVERIREQDGLLIHVPLNYRIARVDHEGGTIMLARVPKPLPKRIIEKESR